MQKRQTSRCCPARARTSRWITWWPSSRSSCRSCASINGASSRPTSTSRSGSAAGLGCEEGRRGAAPRTTSCFPSRSPSTARKGDRGDSLGKHARSSGSRRAEQSVVLAEELRLLVHVVLACQFRVRGNEMGIVVGRASASVKHNTVGLHLSEFFDGTSERADHLVERLCFDCEKLVAPETHVLLLRGVHRIPQLLVLAPDIFVDALREVSRQPQDCD